MFWIGLVIGLIVGMSLGVGLVLWAGIEEEPSFERKEWVSE